LLLHYYRDQCGPLGDRFLDVDPSCTQSEMPFPASERACRTGHCYISYWGKTRESRIEGEELGFVR
jgi:hypothetical protein